MARKRKRNYNPKYTSKRLDMRNGGRVKLYHGGPPIPPIPSDFTNPNMFERAEARYEAALAEWEALGGYHGNEPPSGPTGPTGTPSGPTDETGMSEAEKLRLFNKERSERNIRAGRTAEDIASGNVDLTPDIRVDTVTDASGNVPQNTIADSVEMAQAGMSPTQIAEQQNQRVDTMSATQAAKIIKSDEKNDHVYNNSSHHDGWQEDGGQLHRV